MQEGASWRAKPNVTWAWGSNAEIRWRTLVHYEDGHTETLTNQGSVWINPGQSTPGGGMGVFRRSGNASTVVDWVEITISQVSTDADPGGGYNWQTYSVNGPSIVVRAP